MLRCMAVYFCTKFDGKIVRIFVYYFVGKFIDWKKA